MTAPKPLPPCCRYVCPKCGAPRGFRCNYVTPLGLVQIDREVRAHPARVARWRRLAGGAK